ncbi:class I SAM-dependent DNA methyltransferase [Radiobacillus deserti]|uniref:Class I SAM-dependent methyltransferase n=1 Tax=Radiobacillus deserti TaxID=2594883 RepID=A0A516KGZ2_9BACI|nr:class I SAM-dependent methyltransferase [Radiobacillus deserti]QDP40670.1 class I SAM-dependent methyltransferase [Radiobacillus deserti]
MSYQNMAKVYDFLMKDAPYEEWTNLALRWVKDSKPAKILDLGCGTGAITRRLANNGHQLVGVDYSDDMLSQARSIAEEEHVSIQWIHQDIRELSGVHNQDMAISFCDVLNYITTEEEIRMVFQHVYESLKDGGLFLFDVHSIQHMEEDLKNQIFSEVYEDVSYVWMCESGEEVGEVLHDLTFFVKEEGTELYQRFDETHHQRTFTPESYHTWLEKTGFEVVSIFGDFDPHATTISEAERVFFVSKKVRKS